MDLTKFLSRKLALVGAAAGFLVNNHQWTLLTVLACVYVGVLGVIDCVAVATKQPLPIDLEPDASAAAPDPEAFGH
jgi:hypothetical protein